MLRFKQFEGNGQQLEQAVNAWLTEFEPDITKMSQTPDGQGRVVISFLFEESFRGHELRHSAERGLVNAAIPVLPVDGLPDDPLQVTGDL